jgi:RHS repeat-associated protein
LWQLWEQLCCSTGYEEFHPRGTSAYRSGDSSYDVSPKRYRYTGKERDEATGLDYHGLRYRVPWLGRWSTADPLGLVDGPNLYAYARGNPVRLSDPSGGGSVHESAGPNVETPSRGSSGTAPKASNLSPADKQKLDQIAPEVQKDPLGFAREHDLSPEQAQELSELAGQRHAERAQENAVGASPKDGDIKPGAALRETPELTPEQQAANDRQKMWETAGSDPIAAVYIVLGSFVAGTFGRLLGFEQDPQRAAAAAKGASTLANALGAAGVNKVTNPPTSAPKDPRQTQWGAPINSPSLALPSTGLPGTLAKNPQGIWGKSAKEIAAEFNEAGYTATVRGSKLGKEKDYYSIIEITGHESITQILVSSGGGRHVGPYYKVSTSTEGKFKVVDPETYRADPSETRTRIIPWH